MTLIERTVTCARGALNSPLVLVCAKVWPFALAPREGEYSTAPLDLWGSTSSVLTYLHPSRSADTLTSSSRSALWRLRNSDPEHG